VQAFIEMGPVTDEGAYLQLKGGQKKGGAARFTIQDLQGYAQGIEDAGNVLAFMQRLLDHLQHGLAIEEFPEVLAYGGVRAYGFRLHYRVQISTFVQDGMGVGKRLQAGSELAARSLNTFGHGASHAPPGGKHGHYAVRFAEIVGAENYGLFLVVGHKGPTPLECFRSAYPWTDIP
jgi:hypothetical protein